MKHFVFLICWSLSWSGYAHMTSSNKTTYGYIEKVTLMAKHLELAAKLDTGAKSSSLNALDIEKLEKDGKTYLRFKVPTKQGGVIFMAEYLGKVQIKTRTDENKHATPEPIRRPVVLMRIKLGQKEQDISVNLTNRRHFNYPLLLGRDALKALSGVVDPSLMFTL